MPSEMIEPLLAQTFSLALHKLVHSKRTDADLDRFVAHVEALNMLTTCNRARDYRDPSGVHASLAANNLLGMVEQFRRLPPDERDAMLTAWQGVY